MLINEHPGGFEFFWGGLPEKRAKFFLRGCDLHRKYGMVVTLLSFLCNDDNYKLKLHQEKTQLSWWKMNFYWQIQSWNEYQEWVLLLNHRKNVSKSIMSMMQDH